MKFGFGLLGGTVGYVYVPKSYKVSCTAEYSYLPGPSRAYTINGNLYEDTTTLSTFSIRGNYYPVQTVKWFHVSVGLAYSMSNIMLELPNGIHTIGAEEVEDTSGLGSVDFNALQSYVGLGLGYRNKKGWGLFFDVGANVQGDPNVDFSFETTASQAAIDAEKEAIQKYYAPFTFYPVIQAGATYMF